MPILALKSTVCVFIFILKQLMTKQIFEVLWCQNWQINWWYVLEYLSMSGMDLGSTMFGWNTFLNRQCASASWYCRSCVLMRYGHLCLVHQIWMNWCCTPSIGWYVNQTGIRLGKRVWMYIMCSHILECFFNVLCVFYGFLFGPLN